MTIRETEAWGASQASSIKKSHAKSVLPLEGQAIKEESRSQLNFLSAWQTVLQATPAECCSVLVASYQVLMGQLPTSLLVNPSQGASSSELAPAPMAPSPPALEPSPRPKQQHPSPDLVDVLPPSGATPQGNITGPPSSK